MLDEYVKNQPIVFKTISNQIKKKMISHAYIIETNTNVNGLKFALSFAKTLLCPSNYTNLNSCGNCSQCQAIDNDNFIELKIIEPEGMWITKSQIDDLQHTFIKKSLVGNRKVYIINHFDRMKAHLMDSLLKFIEEPLDGIIALLITDNVNNIMDTIISRCQIISLKKENKEFISDDLVFNIKQIIDEKKYNDINAELIDKAVKFIIYYENNHLKTLLYTKELWHDVFKNNKSFDFALNMVLLFYKDILDYQVNNRINLFKKYQDDIFKISNMNTINKITDKISIVMNCINKLKFNANLNLLLDKLIIDLEKRI